MIDNLYVHLENITDAGKFLEALKKTGKFEMFEPLMFFGEHFFPVCKYILRVYSVDSDYTSLCENWNDTKMKVADLCAIPKDTLFPLNEIESIQLVDGVVHLKFHVIVDVSNAYLELQESHDFEYLLALQETYHHFVTSPSRKVDDDQLFKNMGYAMRIRENIQEYRNRLRQDWGRAIEGKVEVEAARTTIKKKSLSLESKI